MAYLKAKTKAEQKAAVKDCPKEWQELVRKHVEIGKMSKARHRGGKGGAQQLPKGEDKAGPEYGVSD